MVMDIKERIIRCPDLRRVIEIAKADGCRIYTSEDSSKYITYIFIESPQGQVGYCQEYFGGIQFSTVHKSEKNSGLGTGFGQLLQEDFNDPEDYKVSFRKYPYWFNGQRGEVYKYTSFQDYIDKGLKILKYVEI